MKNRINKLYIEPSSLCNLNCRMCFRNNWFDETYALMSDETVEHVIQIIKDDGRFSVFFGGMGEPLMHPKIFEMIGAARDSGKKVELITNATLLTEEVSRRLINSGLDTLWVSMDGFSKESYENVRRGSLYERIVYNLTDFNKVRGEAKLGITFVMMKENLSELAFINQFADKYQVDYINLSHVVPCEELPEENAIYDISYRVGKMRRFDADEVVKKEFDYCPFIMDKVCFIRHDGEVSPCMQLLHNSYSYLYTEKRKIYAKSFGNISQMSLEEIYNSQMYEEFRQRVEMFEYPCCTVCLGCEDRKENITDCMYNIAPTCGACLWAQGLSRCP